MMYVNTYTHDTQRPTAVVEWVPLVLRIYEVLGSILGPTMAVWNADLRGFRGVLPNRLIIGPFI
jgi:hypothetical protein